MLGGGGGKQGKCETKERGGRGMRHYNNHMCYVRIVLPKLNSLKIKIFIYLFIPLFFLVSDIMTKNIPATLNLATEVPFLVRNYSK